MKNVFVTGGSGLVGYHLIKRLRKMDIAVRCLVRSQSRRETLKTLGVDFVEGDLNNLSALENGADGADVVFHIAGLTRAIRQQEFFDVNQAGCRNIAQAVLNVSKKGEKVPAIISVSSLAAAGAGIKWDKRNQEIYGTSHRPRMENDFPIPFSPYGKSKLAGEKELAALSDRIPITIVRPSIVLGEWDKLSLPLFQMAQKTPFFLIPGYKNRLFSFVYAGDLANIMILAAQKGERLTPESLDLIPNTENNSHKKEVGKCSGKGIYFATYPENYLFSDFGKMLRKAVGKKMMIPLRCPPIGVLGIGCVQECYKRVFRRYASLDLDKAKESLGGPWICSSEKAENELGFTPEMTLQEELNRTSAWYVDQKWLP